jgi:glyoxylase I family protein
MNPILGGGGFHHVCIKTRDWERTLRFYTEVLGCTEKIAWNFRDTGRRAVMLDTGDGNYIEIFEDPAYAPAPDGAILHFALRTTKLDEVAGRVRAAGAKITMEPKDVTIATTNPSTGSGQAVAGPVPIRIFFCEGPSGEVIEFFQNALT